MAADWIKMRVDLYRDPKTCVMADALMELDSELSRFINQNTRRDRNVTRNVMRNAVIGALVAVWGVARVQGKRKGDDLLLDGATLSVLDDISDIPGFGEAMESVGWVVQDVSGLVFPRFFEEHNSDYEEQKQKNRERQARYRARKRNVTVTLRNAPREEKEKRREEKKEGGEEAPPSAPRNGISPEERAVIDAWNAIEGVCHCRLPLSAARRKSLVARLRDREFREHWPEAIERVRGSPFCLGENDRGWRASIDWFLRPATVQRLLEGQYDAARRRSGRFDSMDEWLHMTGEVNHEAG